MSVKARFCPSPTGRIHLGNARTAILNALFAKSDQGVFLLRIEDTDPERSTKEYADGLMTDLKWLGLDWDEGPGVEGEAGPYWQSQRQAVYDQYYDELISKDLAYPCFCSEEQLAMTRKVQRASGKPPRYPGTCRHLSEDEINSKLAEGLKPTLRFKIPAGDVVEFNDAVKGPQKFETAVIGDFIIRRVDGTPTFMYCNAIDDALMGVTHVMRGDDHLTNSPRQALLLRALGLPEPIYCHISLIVGSDNAPLSKRHGSKSVEELRQAGFLPIGILNYLARLGHYYEDSEFMTQDELAKKFRLESLSKSPAKFDKDQMLYWQREAVARVDDETLWQWFGEDVHGLVPGDKQQAFIAAIRPNVEFPAQALQWAKVFFTDTLEIADEHQDIVNNAGQAVFQAALEGANQHGEDFKAISQYVKDAAGVKGKALFQPLRVALTGVLHGPDMGSICQLLGAGRIQQRFENVLR
ncbi:MAG: glutamate--tRNA ligase [Legionellales bacterium]|nr:glutamate--tRNA ligase [Legionellales bacterium]|tara:strand:- start:33456 stop:34856 length:1401 start_codon:yes stop_codon:yes gene_type:complete